VPIPNFHGNDKSTIARLTYDWVRFFYRSHVHVKLVREGKGSKESGGKPGLVDPELTIHEYLKKNGYCDAFIYDSLYAMLTGICTCPFEDCKAYPASVILEFYGSGVLFEGTSAVSGGVQKVCKIMSKSISNIHLQKSIVSIESVTEQGQSKVKVTDSLGKEHIFDSVIIASQANQALAMLKNPTKDEVGFLLSFLLLVACSLFSSSSSFFFFSG
jgi:predicted NAD/FAD-binding protein